MTFVPWPAADPRFLGLGRLAPRASGRRARRGRLVPFLAAAAGALALLSGCGASVDAGLLKTAGVHGDRLEKVYVLYSEDVLADVSGRDLRDVDAALEAGDLKKATAGDLRRGQAELRSRVKRLETFERELRQAASTLRTTPKPDFAGGLDDDFEQQEFAKAYTATTNAIQRSTTRDLAALPVVYGSLEAYLDFLEQWEQYVTNGDTAGLVSTGESSDKARSKLNATVKRMQRQTDLGDTIDPLVDRMASAASNSAQLTTLIDELRADHPKSFLPVHLVEKKDKEEV